MVDLLAAARALLERNRRFGWKDGRRYQYTIPSPGSYPFQWFWDSCFHAIALSYFDPPAARSEIESLLAWSRPDGFIPHVIFWRPPGPRQYWAWLQGLGLRPSTTELRQPPVLAEAIEHVHRALPDSGWLRSVLPALERHHEWLAVACAGPDGLLRIISPNETGMDHKPSFDAALGLPPDAPWPWVVLALRYHDLRNRIDGYRRRYLAQRGSFRVVDVLDNAIYARGLRSLARLQAQAAASERAAQTVALAARVEDALLALTDGGDGCWYDYDDLHHRPLRVATVGTLMVLLLESLPQTTAARLVDAELGSLRRFGAPFPVPSVAMDQSAFEPRPRGPLIWRGPTWINTNWYLARALRDRGFEDAARRIELASVELVRRHGFREFYNPLTGEPGGAREFGWSTLAATFG